MRQQRGLSLVELMIGITVGLFVTAAASFLVVTQLTSNRRLVVETQLQQDLRSTADIVVRELRRTGYWGTAQSSVSLTSTAAPGSNPYTALKEVGSDAPIVPDTVYDGIHIVYSMNQLQQPPQPENNAIDSFEHSGFRLTNGAIEMQLGEDNWQQITDPATLTITSFNIVLNESTVSMGNFCMLPCPPPSPAAPACPPVQLVRAFSVEIAGHAAADATVTRSIRATVRPRNDVIVGACPAAS